MHASCWPTPHDHGVGGRRRASPWPYPPSSLAWPCAVAAGARCRDRRGGRDSRDDRDIRDRVQQPAKGGKGARGATFMENQDVEELFLHILKCLFSEGKVSLPFNASLIHDRMRNACNTFHCQKTNFGQFGKLLDYMQSNGHVEKAQQKHGLIITATRHMPEGYVGKDATDGDGRRKERKGKKRQRGGDGDGDAGAGGKDGADDSGAGDESAQDKKRRRRRRGSEAGDDADDGNGSSGGGSSGGAAVEASGGEAQTVDDGAKGTGADGVAIGGSGSGGGGAGEEAGGGAAGDGTGDKAGEGGEGGGD